MPSAPAGSEANPSGGKARRAAEELVSHRAQHALLEARSPVRAKRRPIEMRWPVHLNFHISALKVQHEVHREARERILAHEKVTKRLERIVNIFGVRARSEFRRQHVTQVSVVCFTKSFKKPSRMAGLGSTSCQRAHGVRQLIQSLWKSVSSM